MTFGTGLGRPGKTALALGSALAASLLAGACFNPPAAAVQFACDPAGDAACPAGYECRDDGCCHREGSDGEDGACKLGVGSISAGPTTGATATTTGATGTGSGSSGAAGSSGGPDGTGSSGATSDASTSSGSTDSTSGSSTSTGSQTTG